MAHTSQLAYSSKKICVLYTGGTFGMVRNDDNVLVPKPNELAKNFRNDPNLNVISDDPNGLLQLPDVQGHDEQLFYEIKEYNPLLDSSNVAFKEWLRIARDIEKFYNFYDGFVIVHGTDTLIYTASVLSFMLENLGKPVILTGSQLSVFETRSDGRSNFTSALIVAGFYGIPEVCILFGNKLMRGNRAIKQSSIEFDAFFTPKFSYLASIGTDINVNTSLIWEPNPEEEFKAHLVLNENITLLHCYPGITPNIIHNMLAPPINGAVLTTFGAGNVPTTNGILDALKSAVERGVIIVNCTQCLTGSVSNIYEGGDELIGIGVLPGVDMTAEAALMKLAYVLGKTDWSLTQKKETLKTNLRGELSDNNNNNNNLNN